MFLRQIYKATYPLTTGLNKYQRSQLKLSALPIINMNLLKCSLIVALTLVILVQVTYISGELRTLLQLLSKYFIYVAITAALIVLLLWVSLSSDPAQTTHYPRSEMIKSRKNLRGSSYLRSSGGRYENGHYLISPMQYQQMVSQETKASIKKLLHSQEYVKYNEARASSVQVDNSQNMSRASCRDFEQQERCLYLQEQLDTNEGEIFDEEDSEQRSSEEPQIHKRGSGNQGHWGGFYDM